MENTSASTAAMATGAPRLPQAMARKARKLAGTMSRPSIQGSSCRRCTTRNSGSASRGAGSMCSSLPRRGAGMSGGMATMAPTVAADAAALPSHRCTRAEISSSPSAPAAPLAT